MKALIRLALTALVTYAAWNAANAWLTYFKFKDAVTEASQYGAELSMDQLHERVMSIASEHGVPLDEEGFTIQRDVRHHTLIDGRYTQPINVLPWYSRPFVFEWHVDTFVLPVAK